MLRKVVLGGRNPWKMIVHRYSSSNTSTLYQGNSVLLGSLKQQYLKVAQMERPPKVRPPPPFKIHENCLELGGAVLHRTYNEEEIDIYVERFGDMLNVVRGVAPIKHVDAMGIQGVSIRPKLEELPSLKKLPPTYNGPRFKRLDIKMKDAFAGFLDARGVDSSLYLFLYTWLYVRDHGNLLGWYKAVGTFINSSH